MNNPERVNISVDGRFLLGAGALLVLQLGLKVGQELSEAQLEQLHADEARQQAVDRALNYLSFRPRSRQEVRQYLRRKETTPEIIEAVIARLEALNLINDEQFASFWVESRERFNPRGARALRHELRAKGVERDVADAAVDAEQDDERALRAGRKKAQLLARQPGMDYNTFRTRLGPFLQRRGFGYEVTTRATRALWQELGEGEADEEDV